MKQKKLMIMLDLEGTIVDSWGSRTPLPEKIKLINEKVTNMTYNGSFDYYEVGYGVFSFAVDTDQEKSLAREMAGHSGLPIHQHPKWTPCFRDLEAVCNFNVNVLQKWEIINLMGKDGMFLAWTREYPDVDFILFDDALPFQEMHLGRDGQLIQMISV